MTVLRPQANLLPIVTPPQAVSCFRGSGSSLESVFMSLQGAAPW